MTMVTTKMIFRDANGHEDKKTLTRFHISSFLWVATAITRQILPLHNIYNKYIKRSGSGREGGKPF